jgi:hypothetical protein
LVKVVATFASANSQKESWVFEPQRRQAHQGRFHKMNQNNLCDLGALAVKYKNIIEKEHWEDFRGCF